MCQACVSAIGCKSRIRFTVGSISQEQGCRGWLRIWRKLAANIRAYEQKLYKAEMCGWCCLTNKSPILYRTHLRKYRGYMNEKRIHLPWEIFKYDEVMRNQSHCINLNSDVGFSLKKWADVIVLLDMSSLERWEVSWKQEGLNVKEDEWLRVYQENTQPKM